MKAKLKELEGKYYGTVVEIEYNDGKNVLKGEVEIWLAYGAPSIREIKAAGVTKAQWDSNAIIEGTGGETAQSVLDICDSHYETENSLTAAEALVNAINSKP